MTNLRPGQVEPNELELAIFAHLAHQEPALCILLNKLHVLSRQYTGVGSYTRFACGDCATEVPERSVSLNAIVRMPGVPSGMGAELFCKNGLPECLELFTYGDDHWDGVYDGFTIERTA